MGLYQSRCLSSLLFISPSAWIHTFSHNSLSLSDFLLPSPHSSSSPHLLSYGGSSPVVPPSSVTAPAPCFLHISSPIDSQSLHPIVLSAALLPPTSSLSPLFGPLLPLPPPYRSHFHAENLFLWMKTAKGSKAIFRYWATHFLFALIFYLHLSLLYLLSTCHPSCSPSPGMKWRVPKLNLQAFLFE